MYGIFHYTIKISEAGEPANNNVATKLKPSDQGNETVEKEAAVPVEDFAEKQSFVQKDFASQLTQSTEDRKKEVAEQEAKTQRVKEGMDQSLRASEPT